MPADGHAAVSPHETSARLVPGSTAEMLHRLHRSGKGLVSCGRPRMCRQVIQDHSVVLENSSMIARYVSFVRLFRDSDHL